ncbi:MAG TPA: outer membrane beta-barrel protein [Candidatus Binatia bacterium]|jgi:hypothetical protein|nr:outer membrane beta-barrel protein [Candidatus Binatia bacterium]
MKCNPWTLGLLSAGLISLPAVTQAEEKPSSVLTALSATTLSGYVDTSAEWNPGTGNAHVPGYAWNAPSKADGFNLNVVELNLEKPVDAADNWGAGYKVSLLAGPDASAFNTLSQTALAAGAVNSADFAVKQAYVALHAPVGNGLDFKIGTWDTLIGYEVFESINNPNVTRSYGYTMEPTTHTGVQATYQFCSTVSATAAVADTFGPNINTRAAKPGRTESDKTYMAAVTFTAPTNWGVLNGSTLTACIINGYNNAIGADQTSFYVGATVSTPVTGLKVGACYDYAGISTQPSGVAGGGNIGSAYANAFGLYASFQATEKLSIYGRAEYATTDVAGLFGGSVNETTKTPLIAAGYIETTATLQYDLWKNVLSRLELRWDHSEHGDAFGGIIGGGAAAAAPARDNYFTLLASVAYKF